jgi:death-on-curing protein
MRDTSTVPLGELMQLLERQLMEAGAAEWRTLAQQVYDAYLGWDNLPPTLQEEIASAVRTALPWSDQSLPALLQLFGNHEKVIGRAAALRDSWRYPTAHDLQLANERMSLAPPLVDAERLERALLLSRLMAPDGDAVQRAHALFRALLALQPFGEYNRSTAYIAQMAFLQANGYQVELAGEPDLEHGSMGVSIQPVSGAEPRTFADLIDALVSRYRDALGRAERLLRAQQALAKQESLPATFAATTPVPGPASHWRYLTVQDLIWLNTEITGAPQPYHYDRLEEATYYQYSYRDSRNLPLQAARFLWGYLTYRPFAKGNAGTALIGVLTLLEINGFEVHLPVERAAEWLQRVIHRRMHPLSAIRQIIAATPQGRNEQPIREIAHHLIERYKPALALLHDEPEKTIPNPFDS